MTSIGKNVNVGFCLVAVTQDINMDVKMHGMFSHTVNFHASLGDPSLTDKVAGELSWFLF